MVPETTVTAQCFQCVTWWNAVEWTRLGYGISLGDLSEYQALLSLPTLPLHCELFSHFADRLRRTKHNSGNAFGLAKVHPGVAPPKGGPIRPAGWSSPDLSLRREPCTVLRAYTQDLHGAVRGTGQGSPGEKPSSIRGKGTGLLPSSSVGNFWPKCRASPVRR